MTPEAIAAAVSAVDAALATTDLPARARGLAMVASGGTATALAALDLRLAAYDPHRVHGHLLEAATLDLQTQRVLALPEAGRAALPGLDTGRAAILPAGAIILTRTAAASGAARVRVSDHGVRHAYLRERLAALGVGRRG